VAGVLRRDRLVSRTHTSSVRNRPLGESVEGATEETSSRNGVFENTRSISLVTATSSAHGEPRAVDDAVVAAAVVPRVLAPISVAFSDRVGEAREVARESTMRRARARACAASRPRPFQFPEHVVPRERRQLRFRRGRSRFLDQVACASAAPPRRGLWGRGPCSRAHYAKV